MLHCRNKNKGYRKSKQNWSDWQWSLTSVWCWVLFQLFAWEKGINVWWEKMAWHKSKTRIQSTCEVCSCADRCTKRLLFCRSRPERGPNATTWWRPSSREDAVCKARPWEHRRREHAVILTFGVISLKTTAFHFLNYLIGEKDINWEEEQSNANNCSSCSFTQSLQESRIGMNRYTLVLIWVLTWKLRNTGKKHGWHKCHESIPRGEDGHNSLFMILLLSIVHFWLFWVDICLH